MRFVSGKLLRIFFGPVVGDKMNAVSPFPQGVGKGLRREKMAAGSAGAKKDSLLLQSYTCSAASGRMTKLF